MQAYLLVLICVSLWALIPVVSKLGQTNLDHHQFLFWSSLLSFLAYFIPLALKRNSGWSLSRKEFFEAAGLGFLGTYLYYILLYFGYSHAKPLEVLIIQYSWPLFIVILSMIILNERLTTLRVVSALLGFVAVLLVITRGNLHSIRFSSLRVDLIVLFAAFVFALFSVLSKDIKIQPLPLLTVYFGTALIFSLVGMLIFSSFRVPHGKSILPVLINGILVNGYSYMFWILALRKAEASYVALFVYLTPIISTLYVVLIFGARLSPIFGLSLALIVIAGILNQKSQTRSSG